MPEREAFESSLTTENIVSETPDMSSDVGASAAEAPDIARVVRDFVAGAPDDGAWIEAVTWAVNIVDETAFQILVTASDGTAFGFAARREPPEATVCDIADRLQDFVADNLRVGLPPVPGAARPATARLTADTAVWVDAETGWRCRIGDYPEEPARGSARNH
ncbi:hypothetical protein [Amycolatopsis eburnea]|uniref:Uncharacterized protein n=1 Tax=Amycolatopsis eburnea TaxID=2267691 RepID=A0A3R9FLP5_9PSEU|nr:hypothetical protein [Amycolatopsis eburnea]RSD16257.1 hypothetical protein EIY87_21565 [Amycolatopsis eburnea]